MFEEALFREHILANILTNLTTFATSRDWVEHCLVLFLLLYGAYKLLTRKNPALATYKNLFPAEAYAFDPRKKADWLGLVLLGGAFAVIGFYLFQAENTRFSSPDLMDHFFATAMQEGVVPFYSFRMLPMTFFDLNFAFALSNHFGVINCWILGQWVAIAFVYYHLFRNLPVALRLMVLAAMLLLPAVFGVNNIIFPERMVLLEIGLSLICVRRFSESGKPVWLGGFLLLMNYAIYSKETVIVFYFGMLTLAVLYNIYAEKIVMRSFLHPWRSMRAFPLETLMLLSMVFYGMLYGYVSRGIVSNPYRLLLKSSIAETLFFYRFEIILLLSAFVLLGIKMLYHRRAPVNPIFREGLLAASLAVTAVLFFCLRIVPVSPYLGFRSYFMILPAVFSLWYIAAALKSHPRILYAFLAVLTIFSLERDYRLANLEQGEYYRQAATEIGRLLSERPQMVLMIHDSGILEPDLSERYQENRNWQLAAWSRVLKHYFPDSGLRLKAPAITIKARSKHALPPFFFVNRNPNFTKILLTPLQPGDYLLLKKESVADAVLQNLGFSYRLIYENPLFYLMEIQDAHV